VAWGQPVAVNLKPCDATHHNAFQRWTLLETNQWRNERDGACLEHNGKRQAHCAIAFMSQPQMTNLIGHVTTQVYLTQCNTAAEGQRWWVTTLMDDHLQVQP